LYVLDCCTEDVQHKIYVTLPLN